MENKNQILNFIYCFDNNYNMQGIASITSLLDNVSEKINIHILHNDKLNFENKTNFLENHTHLNQLKIYEVDLSSYKLPNLENVHVSEATYYRMFFEQYLPDYLNEVIYLDADVICVQNPIIKIRKIFHNLYKSDYFLAAKTTEYTNGDSQKRLGTAKHYFNAGVLLTTLNDWRNKDLKNNFLNITKLHFKKIVFWDQDVMNIYFNGNFMDIDSSLNFNSNYLNKDILNEDLIFLHYIGSKKPWSVPKKISPDFEIYHQEFRKSHIKTKYHITHTWKKQSLSNLFRLVSNMQIMKLNYPIRFIIDVFKSFR